MTEEQIKNVLSAIDAAEKWELTTGKEVMTLHVNSEFFKTLKELVADRLDYNKHIPVDEPCVDCVSKEAVRERMIKYGFRAPDMTVAEFIEDELPSVTPKQKTGKWIDKKPNLQSPFAKMYWCDAHAYKSAYCPGCGAKMEGESE